MSAEQPGARAAGRPEGRAGRGNRPGGPDRAGPRFESPPERGTDQPQRRARSRRVRARKVRRIVRHVEPWSVLKISLLFYLAVFLIFAVAGTLLWSVARQAGVVERVEQNITNLFALGDCEAIEGFDGDDGDAAAGERATDGDELDEQFEPGTADDDEAEPRRAARTADGCPEGFQEVGTFEFLGDRIFAGFMLGGLVLVVAGAAFNVVLAVLFNLISDLTGGVRVTVLEEEPRDRQARAAGDGPRDGPYEGGQQRSPGRGRDPGRDPGRDRPAAAAGERAGAPPASRPRGAGPQGAPGRPQQPSQAQQPSRAQRPEPGRDRGSEGRSGGAAGGPPGRG